MSMSYNMLISVKPSTLSRTVIMIR